MENQLNLFSRELRRFLRILKSERGEVSTGNPAGTEELNLERQQLEGGQGTEGTPNATLENKAGEEKLYAGRFKTAEELEDHYKLSSDEGVRLATEVKNLKLELQQAQTPVEKKEVVDKIVNLTDHFDEKTATILNKYVEGKMQSFKDEFHKSNQEKSDFEKDVSVSWEETKKLYPDATNPNSKLAIRATQILSERKLAQVDEKGVTRLLTPFAYRIAVEAADAELSRQAPANDASKGNKNRATSVQGRSSRSAGTGKISYEQYSQLSEDQKDAYDAQYNK